jgi:hypothetical protein
MKLPDEDAFGALVNFAARLVNATQGDVDGLALRGP